MKNKKDDFKRFDNEINRKLSNIDECRLMSKRPEYAFNIKFKGMKHF